MRSWIMSLAVVAIGLIGSDVMAQGCATCGTGGHGGYGAGGGGGHWSGPPSSHHRGGVALQAAPWYLYWPYDAHFQTPAPVFGAYSPPPSMNGYPAQPFFPSHSYGYPYVPGSPLNIYPYGPTVAPGYAH